MIIVQLIECFSVENGVAIDINHIYVVFWLYGEVFGKSVVLKCIVLLNTVILLSLV